MQEVDHCRRASEVHPFEVEDPLELIWDTLPAVLPRILKATKDEESTSQGILRLAERVQRMNTMPAQLKKSPQNYCFWGGLNNSKQVLRDEKKHYQGRLYPSETRPFDSLPGIEHAPDPARLLEENETLDKLEEALKALSPLAWEVLTLKVLEGRTFEQIAVSLEKSLATVRRIYMRTRASIRSSLMG